MTFAYEVLPIVRSLSEIRKINPRTGVKGDLQAIYCIGKQNRELFFRLLWIEYGYELSKYKQLFSVADVVHEVHQGQTFTILRVAS